MAYLLCFSLFLLLISHALLTCTHVMQKVEKTINIMKGCNDLQRQITFHASNGRFDMLNI